jgi:hypothetical protein
MHIDVLTYNEWEDVSWDDTWDSLDLDNDHIVTIYEWINEQTLKYDFSQIANYLDGVVTIEDFTAWEETTDVTFTTEELAMINGDATAASVSVEEYLHYRGYLNKWNRAKDEENRMYFLAAWDDEWTQDEFYWMNLN